MSQIRKSSVPDCDPLGALTRDLSQSAWLDGQSAGSAPAHASEPQPTKRKWLPGFLLAEGFNRKILIRILIFSSILSLLFTAWRLYEDYQKDYKIIHASLLAAEQHLQDTLSRALWRFNDEVIETSVDALANTRHVQWAQVVDLQGREIYAAGERHPEESPMRETVLRFVDTEKSIDQPLGHLRVYARYSVVNDALIERFFWVLYTQTVKTFLVSIFILFLIHKLVTRHLIHLAERVGWKSGGASPSQGASCAYSPIVLRRRHEEDELQVLTDALNRYRTEVARSFAKINSKNQQLSVEMEKRSKAEAKNQAQNALIDNLFNSLVQYVFIVDKALTITRLNISSARRLDALDQGVVGKNITELVNFTPEADSVLDETGLFDFILSLQRKEVFIGCCQFTGGDAFPANITIIPLDPHHDQAYAIIISDESSKERYREISYNANHDYLTGLFNRYRLEIELEKIVSGEINTSDAGYQAGFLDLDGFKTINDILGHQKGDQVLIEIARILRQVLGEEALIARQGGDEFIFVIEADESAGVAQFEQLINAIADHRLEFDRESVSVTASVGVSVINVGQDSVSAVISRIDQACYIAKAGGGDSVVPYDPGDVDYPNEQRAKDYKTVQIVKQAIHAGRLMLYSQQMVPLGTGKQLPYREEVLSRIRHQGEIWEGGKFISSMERARMTHLIDCAVYEKLIQLIGHRQLARSALNVNLSPHSLYNKHAVALLVELLSLAREHDISMVFELTEEVMVGHSKKVRELAKLVHQYRGFLALDDFGKGYASYGYIQEMDVDMIKIDGQLIRQIESDMKKRAIVASVCSIADSINALTVAEHVENQAQMDLLKQMGLDYAQGYFCGKPAPLEISVSHDEMVARRGKGGKLSAAAG